MMQRSRVLLPDPLDPRMETTSWSLARSEMPFSTWREPKLFCMSSTTRAVSPLAGTMLDAGIVRPPVSRSRRLAVPPVTRILARQCRGQTLSHHCATPSSALRYRSCRCHREHLPTIRMHGAVPGHLCGRRRTEDGSSWSCRVWPFLVRCTLVGLCRGQQDREVGVRGLPARLDVRDGNRPEPLHASCLSSLHHTCGPGPRRAGTPIPGDPGDRRPPQCRRRPRWTWRRAPRRALAGDVAGQWSGSTSTPVRSRCASHHPQDGGHRSHSGSCSSSRAACRTQCGS